MKLWRLPYNFLPSTIFYNTYQGITNIIRWVPVIWVDRDWDWSFLARIIQFKLTNMVRLERTHGHHTTSLRDAKNMEICIHLLKRLDADEYHTRTEAQWGNSRMTYKISTACQQADQKLLGRILGRNLTSWWD